MEDKRGQGWGQATCHTDTEKSRLWSEGTRPLEVIPTVPLSAGQRLINKPYNHHLSRVEVQGEPLKG